MSAQPRLQRYLRVGGTQLLCLLISVGLFALPLIYLALQSFKPFLSFLDRKSVV